MLLRFSDGSRDAYHEHAFDSVSWVLRGRLSEHIFGQVYVNIYVPRLRPVWTRRDTMHKVVSVGTTWVLSFRGPWADTWREYRPAEKATATLTHGRREL